MERVDSVITAADKVIRDASARTAENAMEVLQNSVEVLKSSLSSSRRKRADSSTSIETGSTSSTTSDMTDMTMSGMEDFTFTYEEEADPEVFFVPYCWDVIVSTVTASSLEWHKSKIRVFPINENVSLGDEGDVAPSIAGNYAEDVGDVV